jgi:hypothetical protein
MPKYQIRRYNGEIFETDDLEKYVLELEAQISFYPSDIEKISWSEAGGRIILTGFGWRFVTVNNPVGTIIPQS